ncbi:MAG: short-chain dehydrogenase [Candidatus Marinimicrobia bacterium]|nr:short-chain dehydrogenase [Candidatus Neomarinimicrobiota bacterium]
MKIPKNCIITGATDGIGKQTAIELAKLGYNIGLVGRSKEKTEIVLDQIASKSGNHSLKYFIADLSNIKTLDTLANNIRNEYESIDILINNAGAYFSQYIETKENIEKTFALNHLNYFQLTKLLMDIVKFDKPGRIINVASAAHSRAKLDIDDLQMKKGYKGWTAYSNSKLMNILFTYELHKRYQDTGITFNCLHPGFVDTSFGDNNIGLGRNILSLGKKIIAINVEEGARTNIYLASSNEVKNISGKYFYKSIPIKSSKVSYLPKYQEVLWSYSEKVISSLS